MDARARDGVPSVFPSLLFDATSPSPARLLDAQELAEVAIASLEQRDALLQCMAAEVIRLQVRRVCGSVVVALVENEALRVVGGAVDAVFDATRLTPRRDSQLSESVGNLLSAGGLGNPPGDHDKSHN